MSPKFFFECTLGLFATVDLLATVRLFVLMRAMPRRFIWRLIIVLWGAGAMGFCVLIIVANPLVSGLSDPLPRWLTAGAFIWHFLVLPVLVVGLLFDGVVRLIGRVIGWVRPVAEKKVEVEGQPVMVTDPILDLSAPAVSGFGGVDGCAGGDRRDGWRGAVATGAISDSGV